MKKKSKSRKNRALAVEHQKSDSIKLPTQVWVSLSIILMTILNGQANQEDIQKVAIEVIRILAALMDKMPKKDKVKKI